MNIYIYIYIYAVYKYMCVSASLWQYVYTCLCTQHSGWTQRGLNPGGCRFEVKNHVEALLRYLCRDTLLAICLGTLGLVASLGNLFPETSSWNPCLETYLGLLGNLSLEPGL